jgi:hypothetical protein
VSADRSNCNALLNSYLVYLADKSILPKLCIQAGRKVRKMNVFILCAGRCGSVTFIKACQHITNFASSHESRRGLLGEAHFRYPKNHIEADNRLSFFLGGLDRYYGDDALYVHLKRNNNDTAKSYASRWSHGIMKAYREGMITGVGNECAPMPIALDYCDTVNANIELFLKDKAKKMEFSIENAKKDFVEFWKFIGAEGNMDAALSEFDVFYNASEQSPGTGSSLLLRIPQKLIRLFTRLPNFIKNV